MWAELESLLAADEERDGLRTTVSVLEQQHIARDFVLQQVLAERDRLRAELATLTAAYNSIADRYNDQCQRDKEHCKDCCCARSWAALGITEYTGKSIPEHIKSLHAELAELKADIARWRDGRDAAVRALETSVTSLAAAQSALAVLRKPVLWSVEYANGAPINSDYDVEYWYSKAEADQRAYECVEYSQVLLKRYALIPDEPRAPSPADDGEGM